LLDDGKMEECTIGIESFLEMEVLYTKHMNLYAIGERTKRHT